MTIPSFPQFFHLFVIISAGNAADTLADARYGWEGELQKNIFPHQPEPMGENKRNHALREETSRKEGSDD